MDSDRPGAIVVQPALGPVERAGDLMAAESLLQVIELFPGPALVLRPGGEIVGVNDRTERWIGLSRAELRGQPLARFLADPPERVAGFLEDCTRGGRKAVASFTPSRGDGAGGPCRVEGLPVQGGTGVDGPTLVVVHIMPSEPGAAVAAAREDAPQALREEVRREDDLLARLAHDLRNPVAAISGALHLARRATSREDLAWVQDTIERQVKHLVRQLDDLLDLSRITRGTIELKKQRLDAASAARAAAAAVRPLIDRRGHELTLSTSPGDLAIDADPARLEQVLGSLLSHAAESTAPGGRIRLSVAREQDDVVFRVRDHRGKDISPERLPGASDLPEPGAPSESPQVIGWVLIRKLVEMHGGSASVRSEGPGAGGESTVRLPAAAAHGSGAESDAGSPSSAPRGARILIVDDNVDTARGMARLLQLAGHDVRVAHDGRRALEVAHDYHPQFVLLDIVLPGMDGYEVARQLRGDPQLRDAIIIATSGYSVDDYRPPEEAGFDHHLAKPVDHDALRAILGRPPEEAI
jgi:signal transduction histidine kinase/CheY-like chemotaxis protein